MSSATPAGIDRASQLAAGSVAVGLVVLALKFAAWWLTGSVALFSDALESIINVVAAGIAYVALRVSARPADANHPYGHHKAEYFSAVIEGVLIVLAAIAILREAYFAYISPAARRAGSGPRRQWRGECAERALVLAADRPR